MDLRKWDQFGALDSLVKDFTYGLKIERLKIIDRNRKIVYSTEYDLIGTYEPKMSPFDKAITGKDLTVVQEEKKTSLLSRSDWVADTYYPLREVTGNYWMLGNIYGVIQITQDVTHQYRTVQRSIIVIILVAAGLMVFLFLALTLIVRRGENILLERAREQKRLEGQLEQSEKLASIGQMVATIAHEIRNPLGIIRSSAEMLVKKSNPGSERLGKLSNIIVEEATRLSAILTDFLDFAKPKSPRSMVIDVRDVISRVRTNLEQDINRKRIQWHEEEVDGVDSHVIGDPDLLYQAFFNVAINALEAMEDEGHVAVSISSEDSHVQVDFADDGHGISEADLPKIFTPFFTTHEMGTGLGLSVVHNIVAAHGGEISVDSTEGNGTVFRIILPSQGPEEDGSVHRRKVSEVQ